MTPTNAFMELCHDTGTLIPTYIGEDRMCVAMSEQLSIHQGIPSCIPLDHPRLCGLYREHTITEVTLVWHHSGLYHDEL